MMKVYELIFKLCNLFHVSLCFYFSVFLYCMT
jgi:hypothetical protein